MTMCTTLGLESKGARERSLVDFWGGGGGPDE